MLIEAYLTLSRSRQNGMGANPIAIQDIVAYYKATYWSGIEFEEFMGAMQDMDSVYLKWSEDKAKQDAKKNAAKKKK